MGEDGFVRACTAAELQRARILERPVADGRKALLLWVGDEARAYQANCPHQDVALAEGIFDGSVLTCHEHLWQFDAHTGKGLDPEDACLGRFAVRVRDGEIWVSRELISQGSAGASGDGDS